MILVSWNSTSLGSSLKSNAARDIISQEQPDFFLIQETKMSNQEFQKFTKIHKSFARTATDSLGASGGIGTLWNKRKWDLIKQKSTHWWVRTDLKIKSQKKNLPCSTFMLQTITGTKHIVGIISNQSCRHVKIGRQFWVVT